MVIQNAQTNRYVRQYREGTMSQSEAAQRTRDIYRGGGGSSRSQVDAAEAAGRAAREAQAKAAAEKAAQDKIKQEAAAKVLAEQQKQQQLLEAKKAAVYSEQYQGVITSEGEYYPTKNRAFIPQGAVQGYGYSVYDFKTGKGGEAVGFKPNPVVVSSGGSSNLQSIKPTETKQTFKDKAVDTYNKAEAFVSSKVTTPAYNYLASKGIDLTSASFQSKFTPSIIGIGPFGFNPKSNKDLYGSAQAAANLDIKEKPIKNIALVGAGAVAGSAVKGIQITGTALGIGKATNIGLGVAGAGLTGKAVYDLNKQLAGLSGEEKAATIGVFAKDIGLTAIGFSAGSKATAYRYERIEVTQPLRDVKIPQFKEVQQTAIVNGKEINLASLKITGERTPPMQVIKTTQYRLDKGFSPLELVKTIPAKKFTIKSLGAVNVNEPYIAETFKFGLKNKPYNRVGLSEISGASRKFNPKLELNNLNPTERYALNKFVQRQTGRFPKQTSKLFSKDSELSLTNIREVKYGNINVKDSTLNLNPLGRRTTRAIGISKDFLIGENEAVQIFKSTTEFKDITNPLARASGKTQALKGTIVRIKEPMVFDTTQKNLGLDLKVPKKTSWSSTFGTQQTVQQNIQQLPKPSFNVKPTGVSILSTPTTTLVPVLPTSKLFTRTQQEPAQREVSKTIPTSISKDLQIGKTVSISKEITKPISRSISKQVPITKQEPIQKQIPKEITLPVQKPVYKTIGRINNIPYGFAIPKTPRETKVGGFIIPKAIGGSKKSGIFGVQIRRQGKWFNVGTSKSAIGALNLGRYKTSTTLARSFRLTGRGSKGLALPKGFRTSKRDKSIFVEKSKFALSTKSELNEILGYRSRKRKKKSIWEF